MCFIVYKIMSSNTVFIINVYIFDFIYCNSDIHEYVLIYVTEKKILSTVIGKSKVVLVL
jgi:hypothetical protein